MKIPTNLGLGMLTLGLILMSTRMAQCTSFLGVSLANPFSNAALTPPSLAPAEAPAPGPSMSMTSPRQSDPSWSSSTPGLIVGFYQGKCDFDVEENIEVLVEAEFRKDSSLLAAFLRLQFHDCFIHGCDASILVDGPSTEKTAEPNLSVRGYEVIATLKAAIEADCQGVVSCADIIAIATKVLIKLGGGIDYPVETGRRDGLVSNAADVNLPDPSMTVSQAAALFATKKFTLEEMVVLLGYHAVGNAHCKFFQDRLYETTGQFDALMDSSLRSQLRQVCPSVTPPSTNFTPLNQDPTNNNILNNGFYGQLIGNRGILALDQALSRDPTSASIVSTLAKNLTLFNIRAAQVMIKLQAVDVLTGSQGEVRKVCSKFNN